jgi:hypothetical protein
MDSFSAIHQEYEEGFDTLGDIGTVFYKFFSLFSARLFADRVEVRFGPNISDEELSRDVVQKFREYLKEQKEWIREQGRKVNKKQAIHRMWWVVEKMIEFGIFSSSEQKTVMIWLDICLDRVTES